MSSRRMKLPIRLIAVLAVCACFAQATPARALDFAERSGALSLRTGLGLNGCTGGRCDRLAPMLYTRLDVDYRLLPYLAVGVHFAALFQAAKYPTYDDAGRQWDMVLGPEARVIMPLEAVDLWVGAMIGYARTSRSLALAESRWQGFSFGAGLGGDYFIVQDRFTVGAEAWFYAPVHLRVCTRFDGPQTCSGPSAAGRGRGAIIAVGATATLYWDL